MTNDPSVRFIQHKRDAKTRPTYPIHHSINKYEDLIFDILCIGTQNYIYNLESKLRPVERIGGSVTHLDSKARQSQAEGLSSLSRTQSLFIMIKYFIKNQTCVELGEEYNAYPSTIYDVIIGTGIKYPEIDSYRKKLKSLQKYNSKIKGSLSEDQYNDILNKRESGLSYNFIAKDYGVYATTIGDICKGIPKYLQRFKSFRIIN